MLALCIPLTVLAASLGSKVNGGQNKDPAKEQTEAQESRADSKIDDSQDSNSTQAERESAADIAQRIDTQSSAVQVIRQQDAVTGEQRDGSSSTVIVGDGTNTNAVAGFIGGTSANNATAFRMSLARLDNLGAFASTGDYTALEAAVQEYGSKYYVACEGGALYYPSNRGCPTTNRGKAAISVPSGSIAHQILSGMYHDATNSVISKRASDSEYINLDEAQLEKLLQELSQIDSYNKALYDEWKSGKSTYPIVAVVEVVGLSVNGKHAKDSKGCAWVSVADCAYEIGGESAYSAFLERDLSSDTRTEIASVNTGGVSSDSNRKYASQSDIGIAKVTGFPSILKSTGSGSHDWWPYFYTKHMFGTWWPNGEVSDSTVPVTAPGTLSSSWSLWAYQMWQTKSDAQSGIVGCTMFTLKPGYGGLPSGVFDWHIDVDNLPVNLSGHAEDASVEYDGRAKKCRVGSVSLYNENWNQWEWYLSENGVKNVSLEAEIFYTSQSTFTLEQGEVLGKRTGGAVKQDRATFSIPLTSGQLVAYMKDRNTTIPDILSMDVLGPAEDSLRVSYAMTLKVKLDNGTTINLTNDDVHWAIYGTDEGRTFKFEQKIGNGYAQIKQGELDNVDFEAMAGTPTTSPLFVTWGGDQYVVTMQYRYVEDDYVRTYNCVTKTVPNITYYRLSDQWETGVHESGREKTTFDTDKSGNDFGYAIDLLRDHYKDGKTLQHDDTEYLNEVKRIYDDYKDAAISNLEKAKTEANAVLHGLVVDTNYDTYKDLYKACVQAGEVPTAFTQFIDSTEWHMDEGRESAVVPLFQGVDPETGEAFDISAQLVLVADSEFSYESEDQRQNWLDREPDITDQDRHDSWAKDEPEYDYAIHYQWNTSFQFKVVLYFNGVTELSAECVTSPKELSDQVVIEQKFNKVKYMDILDCNIWRLKEGAEIGAGAILCAPYAGADKIINAAVEQLGYTLYDSLQQEPRGWDEGKSLWRAVKATDLEETKRLVNTYNENLYNNSIRNREQIFVAEKFGDTIEFMYDPSTQGGRSHRSFYKFIAQAAANTFYDGTGLPYRNTILCTSDMLAIQPGDTISNKWLPFVYHQFDTTDYTDVESLHQYILSPKADVQAYCTADYVINGNNPSASAGNNWNVPIFTAEDAYLGGVVELDKSQDYLHITRESLCVNAEIPGAYSFVSHIDEKAMPRVGYRGDWNTESYAHTYTGPDYGAGFAPEVAIEFFNEMDTYKAGATVAEGIHRQHVTYQGAGERFSEFPYVTELNVVRNTTNNQYKMGDACLVYDKVVEVPFVAVDGVLPVLSYNNYTTTKAQKLKDAYQTIPKRILIGMS